MAAQPNTPETEIKVEDLLRLKRSERPDEQFWNQFDRELHQRMLSTLVKKDPWYTQVLRGVTGRIAQAGFVATAAAALAVLVVVRPAMVGIEQEPAAQLAVEMPAVAPKALAEVLPESVEAASVMIASVGQMDYSIDSISAREDSAVGVYQHEFDLDRMEVVALDRSAYTADDAGANSFRSTATMASLAF
ncbi:MAG: hypothetical protein ACPGES_01105 [Coraliomargarita sp.]